MINGGDADETWAEELEEENHRLEECPVKLNRQQLASKMALAAPSPGEAAASVANTVMHRVEMDQKGSKVSRASEVEEFDW